MAVIFAPLIPAAKTAFTGYVGRTSLVETAKVMFAPLLGSAGARALDEFTGITRFGQNNGNLASILKAQDSVLEPKSAKLKQYSSASVTSNAQGHRNWIFTEDHKAGTNHKITGTGENVPNGGNQNPDPNDPRNNKLRHTVFAAIGGFTGYHLDGKTLESGVIYEGPNGETRQYLGPAGESAYVHTNDADTRAATTASFAGLAGLFSWNPYTGLAASGISALTYYVTKGAITDNQ